MSYYLNQPGHHAFERVSSLIELQTPTKSSFDDSSVRHVGREPGPDSHNFRQPDRIETEELQAAEWKPGFWAQFPVWGIIALFGVLASTIAGIVILVVSDHKALDEWGSSITPAVSMAICSVVANVLLAYALANGLVISFWRSALRGHTLYELNQNWLCGHSLQHAILRGFRAGGRITAIACILSMISTLRGPLNQRASRVESNVKYDTSGTVSLAVAQQLEEGYTGLARDSRAPIMETSRLTPVFAQIMQSHSVRSNITIDDDENICGDSCYTSVKGFGFKTECNSTEYVQWQSVTDSYDQTVFATSATLYPIDAGGLSSKIWNNAGILLNVTHAVPNLPDTEYRENKTPTRLRTHLCNVTGGIVEYQVRIDGKIISLSGSRSNDKFLEDLVLPGPGTWGHHSTIGGFQYAASYLFESKAVFAFSGAISDYTFTGSLANQQVQSEDGWSITFADPMDSLLDSMRDIAFRTSIHAGKNETTHNITKAEQNVPYRGTTMRSIYVSDWRYMIGAAVVSILSVLGTGLTYWGWWELGRSVSLNPLEIARAFEAPLLKLESPSLVGRQRIQYGKEIKGEEAGLRDLDVQSPTTAAERLKIGAAGSVRMPGKGEAYNI